MQGTTTASTSREGLQYETPSQGEWRVGELGQIFHANGTKVAECYLPSADFLLAAAPEMLAVLELSLISLRKVRDVLARDGHVTRSWEVNENVKRIKAAIAAAKAEV